MDRLAPAAQTKNKPDEFLPPSVMIGAMESEIGSEAAEFSIHAGNDDHG